jgi:N-methylhydantoinase A
MNDLFARMESQGRAQMAQAAAGGAQILLERRVDLRLMHQHQVHSIILPSARPLTARDLEQADSDFREAYSRAFGLRPQDSCELVNYRLRVTAVVDKPRVAAATRGDGHSDRALKGTREAHFIEAGGYTATRIYDRLALLPGDVVEGPAIIEEPDSATVCPPGYEAEVDASLNLRITRTGRARFGDR